MYNPPSGFRVLIIDTVQSGYKLAELLKDRNKVNIEVTAFNVVEAMQARSIIDQFDLFFIDPFSFFLTDAVVTIAAILSRPNKSVALFRKSEEWMSRASELQGLAISYADLNALPSLDKSRINDLYFGRDLQSVITRMTEKVYATMRSPEPQFSQSGLWQTQTPDQYLPRSQYELKQFVIQTVRENFPNQSVNLLPGTIHDTYSPGINVYQIQTSLETLNGGLKNHDEQIKDLGQKVQTIQDARRDTRRLNDDISETKRRNEQNESKITELEKRLQGNADQLKLFGFLFAAGVVITLIFMIIAILVMTKFI